MKRPSERLEFWRENIAQQERSEQSIRAFCRERGLPDHAFCAWRKQVRREMPVTFALVETRVEAARSPAVIEVALGTGEHLRIPCEAAALRVRVERTSGSARVIHLPASVRVYLCTSPCDMRRSFDGLQAIVTNTLQLDVLSGHLFVFCQPPAGQSEDRVLGSRQIRGGG